MPADRRGASPGELEDPASSAWPTDRGVLEAPDLVFTMVIARMSVLGVSGCESPLGLSMTAGAWHEAALVCDWPGTQVKPELE